MEATKIIDELGGKAAVCSLTGAKPNAVTQWARIGIPSKFWDILVGAAQDAGKDAITFDAMRASKPRVAA